MIGMQYEITLPNDYDMNIISAIIFRETVWFRSSLHISGRLLEYERKASGRVSCGRVC